MNYNDKRTSSVRKFNCFKEKDLRIPKEFAARIIIQVNLFVG